ncbi:MAG TPA: TGS domain-containing protein [Firmicutes bacterium]|nr:TGS domain-containing protein [Candidatus Fermentithermobacillaceae bacterium]
MPANLGPEYLAAEERYRQAITNEEKLAALEEMLATIPKHKGTEKMQADIKRRISKLKEEMRAGKKGPHRKELFRIEKEGAGQVIMVGPPNSGKSHLLKTMSKAEPEVAEYPFTTRLPLPGMVQWENVQIQLVDMPPLTPETAQSWMWAILRLSDGLLLVFDLGDDDILDKAEELLRFMEANNLKIKNEGPRTFTEKKALCAANKCDLPGAYDRLELLKEVIGSRMDIVPCSAKTKEGISELCSKMFFDLLGKIRVYTHPPGKKADFSQPFILDKGTTVIDAAREIHKEIAANLKYARVWGKGVFEGQMVPRDHVLHDGDVVVFYT